MTRPLPGTIDLSLLECVRQVPSLFLSVKPKSQGLTPSTTCICFNRSTPPCPPSRARMANPSVLAASLRVEVKMNRSLKEASGW